MTNKKRTDAAHYITASVHYHYCITQAKTLSIIYVTRQDMKGTV